MDKKIKKALEVLGNNLLQYDDGSDFSASMIEAFNIIEKALTPPTSKEVCKALKKWYKKQKLFIDKIEYDKKNKAFVNGFFILVNYIDSMLLFEVLLPPYLVTLISRFYEGVVENEWDTRFYSRTRVRKI